MKTPMAGWLLIASLLVAVPGGARAHSACAGVERAGDNTGVQASEKSSIKTPGKSDKPESPSDPRSEKPSGPKTEKSSSDKDSDSDDMDDEDDKDSGGKEGGSASGKKGKKTVLTGGQGGGSGKIEPKKPSSVKGKGKKDFITCPATGKRIKIGKKDNPGASASGGQGPDSAVSSGGTDPDSAVSSGGTGPDSAVSSGGTGPDSAVSSGGTGPGADANSGGQNGPVTTADATGGKTLTGDVEIKDATITYSGGQAIDGNTGMTTNDGLSTVKGDVEVRDGVVKVEPDGTIVIVSGTVIGRNVTTHGGTQSPLDALGDVVVDPGVDNPQVNAVYSDGPVQ